jgi:hypothetical protein
VEGQKNYVSHDPAKQIGYGIDSGKHVRKTRRKSGQLWILTSDIQCNAFILAPSKVKWLFLLSILTAFRPPAKTNSAMETYGIS